MLTIEIILASFCIIEGLIIYVLAKKYETLFEEIIQVRQPDLVLPKYRNQMYEKIQEDRMSQERRQKAQDFLDVIKAGECNNIDLKKFGVELDN